MTGYRQDATRRTRLGLLILAAPTLITGAWAVLAPASWYADYGHGIAPPSAFGEYNEHFVQDLGSGYLGVGAVLVCAVVWMHRQVIRAALIGFLVFTVPHLLVHVIEAGKLDRVGYLFTVGLLAVATFLAVWLWRLNDRREPEGDQGLPDASKMNRSDQLPPGTGA
jgi:hypothetical protein